MQHEEDVSPGVDPAFVDYSDAFPDAPSQALSSHYSTENKQTLMNVEKVSLK